MAARVWTNSFGYGRVHASAQVILHSPTPSFQSVLRDVLFHNSSTASAEFQLWQDRDDSRVILISGVLEPGVSSHIEMRHVIELGWTLSAYSAAADWSVSCTGYLLEHMASLAADNEVSQILPM